MGLPGMDGMEGIEGTPCIGYGIGGGIGFRGHITGAGHGTRQVGVLGIHLLWGGHWYGLHHHPGYWVLGTKPGNGLNIPGTKNTKGDID